MRQVFQKLTKMAYLFLLDKCLQKKNNTVKMRIHENFKALCLLLAICTLPTLLTGQEIKLNNPSFEDAPQHSTTPYGWKNCGDINESPPDIQPGHFEVTKRPSSGKTYLGLVTRDNDTWEGVSQRLTRTMKGGECYKFSIQLAKAERYISLSKATMENENFKEAVRLRVWGGNSHCSKKELLGETTPVSHTGWKKYDIEFKPKSSHNYLFIEAYFKKGAFFPYNGNLLLDNLSSIRPCKEPEKVIANVNVKVIDKKTKRPLKGVKIRMIDTKSGKVNTKSSASTHKYYWKDVKQGTTLRLIAEKDGYNKTTKEVSTRGLGKSKTFNVTIAMTKKPKVVDDRPIVDKEKPKDKKEVIDVKDFDKDVVKKGTIMRTEEIQFPADKYDLKSSSYPILDEVYTLLKRNPAMIIEVGGHTNNIPDNKYCDWLSRERAKAVADYLTRKGIPKGRISFKGYGKRNPIATNKTREGRRKNQRVDIKILDF